MASQQSVCVRMVTEVGDILFEIYEQQAPKTSRQFLRYVEEGYYNGGFFYRASRSDDNSSQTFRWQPKEAKNGEFIDVIQGGPHEWKMRRGAYPPVQLEPTSETGLKHVDGAISLARIESEIPNYHFFVCVGDQPELDAGGKRHKDGMGFPAFGKVIEGMEVVRRIHGMKAEGQAIIAPVRILSATRE